MNNVRGLYPPLYGATPSGGGGGGGQHIQVDALPEASLQYKDKIVQYVGASTETLTNGYFYKCVEHTTTEGETITVTYSWDNVAVMNNGLVKHEYNINLASTDNWYPLDANITNNNTDFIIGMLQVISKSNVVTYLSGYNDANLTAHIYIANDSGLSFYGRAKDVTPGTTFKVIIFVKEKEV